MSSGVSFPKKFKLVSLGEQSVGKTSLITRFMYDHFESTYQATIGIDFLVKTVTVKGRSVRLQLWDTAGQERFRSLIPCYIRESGIALVVYDVTSKESFHQTSKWIQDVREERGDDVVIVMVANKTDLEEKRLVTLTEGEDRAKELKVLYMETSAKTGHNVKEVFLRAASELPELNEEEENPKRAENNVTLLPSKEDIPQQSGYCTSC